MRHLLTFMLLFVAGTSGGRIVNAQEEPAHRFTILIANDDGFRAPGIVALIDSLAPFANVVVAAPAVQQSGMGHGITYRDPITVREVPNDHGITWYAIEAKPATVVKLALESLLDSPPDLVVSGINSGVNLGLSAWLSGTVGAAREAAFNGIPAIAVSRGGRADYAASAGFVRHLIEHLREQGMVEPGLLLNVNIPPGIRDGPKGIRVVRLSLVAGEQRYERHTSPRGQVYFWDNWSPPAAQAQDTDIYAFGEGYVTITPLRIDQTDYERLTALLEATRP